jgi:hypothetical protein
VQEGAVTSLSANGCFVLTGGQVESKELVRLEIELAAGNPLYLWGEVVDAAYEIGFAVRFNSMGTAEEERLRHFMDQALVGS